MLAVILIHGNYENMFMYRFHECQGGNGLLYIGLSMRKKKTVPRHISKQRMIYRPNSPVEFFYDFIQKLNQARPLPQNIHTK